MPRDKQVPLEFPGKGIDTSTEFTSQPDGSTAGAANVRVQDPIAELFRGGSRPGTSKLVADQVAGSRAPVQHLAVLVHTDAEAVNTDYNSADSRSYPATHPSAVLGDDYIIDPSTNNNAAGLGDRNPDRAVPVGGSGRPHVRMAAPVASCTCARYKIDAGVDGNYYFQICTDELPLSFSTRMDDAGVFWTANPANFAAPGPAVPTLAELNAMAAAYAGWVGEGATFALETDQACGCVPLVQKKANGFGISDGFTRSLAFDATPAAGDLLVVVVGTLHSEVVPNNAVVVTTVVNNVGAAFTQAAGGTYSRVSLADSSIPGNTISGAVSVWYKIADGTADDATVKVTLPAVAGAVLLKVMQAEFSGKSATPADSYSSASDVASVTDWTTGAAGVAGTCGLVLGAFLGIGSFTVSFDFASGVDGLFEWHDEDGFGYLPDVVAGAPVMALLYAPHAAGPGTFTINTVASSAMAYCSLGTSWLEA